MVPTALAPQRVSPVAAAAHLQRFLEVARGRTTVLTGAGVSTDSGIPDYRGPNGVYVRNRGFTPLRYQEFVGAHAYRQRYWARSFLGWPKIQRALPNSSHKALARLQQSGALGALLTQNVDGLHAKGGARRVLELHGSLHEVECVACRRVTTREAMQRALAALNPAMARWATENPERDAGDVASSVVNPDGDVEITWNYDAFEYPCCEACGGMLKPKCVTGECDGTREMNGANYSKLMLLAESCSSGRICPWPPRPSRSSTWTTRTRCSSWARRSRCSRRCGCSPARATGRSPSRSSTWDPHAVTSCATCASTCRAARY